MTRICFFNGVSFWGGGEKWHFETGTYLSLRGHRVYFITQPGGELHQRLKGTNINELTMTLTNASFLNLFKIGKLVRFFKTNRIETVVFNGSAEVKTGAPAARMAGVKAIVYRRGIALPVKSTVMNRWLYQRLITHFLTNSRETSQKLFAHLGTPMDSGKVRVVYNGIDYDQFASVSRKVPMPDGQPIVLGSAGRLEKQKGQDYLLQVASILKSRNIAFQMHIAGEGPLRQSLERQIKTCGLDDQVHLLGFVADMRGFFEQLDIFIFPSLWEGFGYAIAEAMAAGLPVVAFDISSNPEVVEQNETGFLVAPGQAQALAEKTAVLAKNPRLRLQMGKKGQARVCARFNRAEQLSKLEAYLCEDVLKA
ncbi:glycosyltransferase family 4 protein [Desulfosarcina sp.]|uniref:glycosyltransferase family 4 protein n=1 Tax=Desulfosarcina sp. TaxID=2027861 RepID=UPI00397102F9